MSHGHHGHGRGSPGGHDDGREGGHANYVRSQVKAEQRRKRAEEALYLDVGHLRHDDHLVGRTGQSERSEKRDDDRRPECRWADAEA